MKKSYLVLGIIMILSMFSVLTYAEDMVVIEDNTGDDYGPGMYHYPRHEDFKPYEGLFDIKKFSLETVDDYYQLKFVFSKLTNPWNKVYGFSHPLIELYIDNQKGGSTESFMAAARVNFDSDHPWNKLLRISGEFVKLYTSEDEIEEYVDLASDLTRSRWELDDAQIGVENNSIIVKIRQDLLGDLKDAYVYLLVGSFNPFGYGYYRDIRSEPSNWYFSAPGISSQEIVYAPRVIDIILPENKNQRQVLANFDQENYAVVYPVSLDKSESYYQENYIFPVLAIIIIFSVIYYLSKKHLT